MRAFLSPPTRLAELTRGRDNNLTLLRLLAAIGVVYGHAFGIPQRDDQEPVHHFFGLGTGDLGVDVFFFVSGLLVTKSFLGKGVVAFAWARFTRIFPGLWMSILVLVGLAGLLFSPLPAMEFWLRPETLSYVAHNATMLPGFGAQTSLPYALNNPNPLFNTPLWTLPHELQMYMLLALIGVLGGLRYTVVVGTVVVAAMATAVADKAFGMELIALDRSRFLYFFFAGSLAYLARDRIVVSTRGLLICLALVVITLLATHSYMVRQGVLLLLLPYMVLWFAYIPRGKIREFNKVGDYSYGVYIYAFPIQMLLIGTAVGSGSIANFLLSTLIVLPIAAASWHLLERHALRIPLPLVKGRLSPNQGAAE